MTNRISITRRLVVTVLVLELLSAIALIGAITVHERDVQLRAFDASLLAGAEGLMGAVQDAEDAADNVMLDMQGVQLARDAAFRVEDEKGRVLGVAGNPPRLELTASNTPTFHNVDASRHYRFVVLRGLRIIDPGQANGGARHTITVVYGTGTGHMWHEVVEAIRFFAIATLVLMGATALLMAWLVRRGLAPVYELAREAEHISSKDWRFDDWRFDAPASAKNTVELQPLAAALEAALERVQRSFEQQKRFMNDAAHELKTDVAIVKSSLQLLSMNRRTVEEYIRGLATSVEDFTRLEMTVQKMLTLARLEQPPEKTNSGAARPSSSLCEVIEDAMSQCTPLAKLKAIAVNLDFSADARVAIDSRDALLLCSNILLNALQHSPNGGAIRISLTVDDEVARLTVQDRGEGISESDLVHVFEPFYRGDPSRSRKSGGTGLGLSICKAICESAGGSIEIANSSTGGALVTVKLPATRAASPLAPQPSASFKA